MGGEYYDRDVSAGASNGKVGVTYSINPGMDPKRWKDEKMKCTSKDPVVFALDVTGSM